MKEGQTDNGAPIIRNDGKVNWKAVVNRSKNGSFTDKEKIAVVAGFETIESEVDGFLHSGEGREYLSRLDKAGGIGQNFLIIQQTIYEGKTLSYVALGRDGFYKWGFNQSEPISTEEALRFALHGGGELVDLNQFVSLVKQEIDTRVPKS